jgi:thioredoxin-like negative regulator of GroEL
MKIAKSIDKMMTRRIKTLTTMFRPSNLPKLISLLVLLVALYYVYKTYLKEGMENECNDVKFETTPDKFDSDVLQGAGRKLVLFYAGWCGHCQDLKPKWCEISTKVNTGDKSTWKLWKVNVGGNDTPNDATEQQKALGSKYPIKGYPTILIFEDGKMVNEYEGPRTEEGIIQVL